jgi:hypothetical protein
MKQFYKLSIALVFMMSTSLSIFAQQKNAWKAHTSLTKIKTDKAVARLSFPTEFKLFDLNAEMMQQELFKVVDNATSHTVVISLPNAAGEIEQFELFEASNFDASLQARFPMIRAFSGKGLTDKYATLKLSFSPQGIQTMVFRTDKPNEFIEPYSQDHTVYAVFTSNRAKGQLPWTCSTPDQNLAEGLNAQISFAGLTSRSTGDLKTMRLAQSCNAEYSNYFGATSSAQVGLVLAAYNATLTRCNGCYEKDLALHLNLIDNTTQVIYYVAGTDPYTTMGQWNAQLQSTLNSVIGAANYDIGHMFGASGGGGNAGCIGCVCSDNNKGSGITSPADGIPQGDNFDIDYVVHEVGHQLGANHTFSMSLEGSGVNKEVGSGITIMGYAGITAQDVAPHSIDIYHEASIAQIQANITNKTCPITTSLAGTNATPVVAPVANYIIPKSTPFALTGSATDADADALTYCWEQNDNSTVSGANSKASPTKTAGPNWLSFKPTASPTRICPQLATVLAGGFTTGPLAGGTPGIDIEALSSVARTLNFRLTVRDNSPYSSTAPIKVGQTQFTDMQVTVNGTSGPFAVSIPNTAVSWRGLTTQTVTWSVNGSDLAPVSCANVKISLSIDGGYTWPYVLAASTPNDGTEAVTIPDAVSATARVKVEAVGNIFFDISNTNFTITQALPGFAFDDPAAATVTCGVATSASTTLGSVSILNFVTPIVYTASGNPAGTTVTFSDNNVIPGNNTVVTLNNISGLNTGTYTITITGTAGAVVQTKVLTFNLAPTTAPSVTTQPVNSSACAGNAVTYTVVSPTPGVSYQWQESTNGGTTWTDIVGANSATYTIASAAANLNNNRYRVIISTQCGITTSSAVTLSVTAPTAITAQPNNSTICVGQNANFTSNASGVGVTYQWEVSTDGGATWTTIAGATNRNYSITAPALTLSNNKYRVIATVSAGTCPGSVTSNVATLVVNPTPVVAATTNVTSVCTGSPAVLTASGANTYAWTPGNLTGSSVTVNPVVNPNSPGTALVNTFTVVGTNTQGCTNTTTVQVTANPLPRVTITSVPNNPSLFPGLTATLTANVTPSTPNTTYQWYKNNVLLAGQTAQSIVVDIDGLGSYKATAAINGFCESTSINSVTVKDSASDILFIYPNPNKGAFQVRFNDKYNGESYPLSITIYDAKGSRVYKQSFTPGTTFGRMDVILKNIGSGVYFVDLTDASGVRLQSGKVVIKP